MSERDSETARERGREGGRGQYMGKTCNSNRSFEQDRNNVGTVQKGRVSRWGSHPQSVLTGAERRVGDGLAAGGSLVFLPVSPPPHPSDSSTASRHLSPSRVFVSLLQHTLFFILFFVICLSTLPSLPFFTFD